MVELLSFFSKFSATIVVFFLLIFPITHDGNNSNLAFINLFYCLQTTRKKSGLAIKSVTQVSQEALCPELQRAMANPTTLDISCPTIEPVSTVIISGPGVGFLCSFYISKGINLSKHKRKINSA